MLPDHSVLKWSSDDLLGTLQPLGMKLMPRVLHIHTHMHTNTQALKHTQMLIKYKAELLGDYHNVNIS